MSVPSPWQFLLLALASCYLFYLASEASIFDRPRAWILGYTGYEPAPKGEKPKPLPASYRQKLGDMVDCPWCLGCWMSIVLWGAWQIWPHAVTVIAVPPAVCCFVGIFTVVHRLVAQYLEN